MRFYVYVFYFIRSFYKYRDPKDNDIHAFIILGATIMVNIFSMVIFLSLWLNFDINAFRVENRFINRFIIIPLLISPIYITLYFIYLKNKSKIKEYLKSFKAEDEVSRRKNRRTAIIYLIFSWLLIFFAAISPAFFH
jgi:hypothetical protein